GREGDAADLRHRRVRHLAAARCPQSRSVSGQSGIVVPVAVPPGAGRQAEARLARDREQPARQVLPAHRLRQAPARAASRAMESRVVRRHECPRGRLMFLNRLASMARWTFSRSKAEADMDDELHTFVDMAAADHVRDGATPAEARRLAMLQVGGVEPVKERVRTGRHGAWLDVAGRDARYGLRQLRRDPAFAAIAIATLALGIGGVTAMFSAFDAVLIRPLPY